MKQLLVTCLVLWCTALLISIFAVAAPESQKSLPENAVPPIIPDIIRINDGSMLPLQPFAALTGVAVTVKGTTYTVSSGNRSFMCTIGSPLVNVNGEPEEVPMAPFVVGETLYIPYNELFRALGWKMKKGYSEISVECPGYDQPLVFYAYNVPKNYAEFPDPAIYLMNLDGTGLTRLTYTGCSPEMELPVFSPDGKIMVYRRGKNLCRREVTGKAEQVIAVGPGKGYTAGEMVISSDNQRAAWSTTTRQYADGKPIDTYELQLIPLHAPGTIIKLPGRMPQFSPDGATIAFSRRNAQGQDEICLMNADGSDLRVMGSGIRPYFSPDGSHLVWTQIYPSLTESLTIRVLTGPDAGKCYMATAQEQRKRCERFVAFSADGRKVIFQVGEIVIKETYYDVRKPLYEMELNRTAIKTFTAIQPPVELVGVTPDRKMLLFQRIRWEWGLSGKILDTGKVREIILNKRLESYAVTPDGKRIVFRLRE